MALEGVTHPISTGVNILICSLQDWPWKSSQTFNLILVKKAAAYDHFNSGTCLMSYSLALLIILMESLSSRTTTTTIPGPFTIWPQRLCTNGQLEPSTYCSHLSYWSHWGELSFNPVWAWLTQPHKQSEVKHYGMAVSLLPPQLAAFSPLFTLRPTPRAVSHASALGFSILCRALQLFPLGFLVVKWP